MANKITASIEFYFKGEAYTPTIELDLDALMQRYHTFPNLYNLLAKQHNIDTYSYQYEMLLAETIQFSDAQGLAKNFMLGTNFDQTGFEQYWQENNVLSQLAPVIKQHLNIDDIEQQQDLKSVLLAAWKLGKPD